MVVIEEIVKSISSGLAGVSSKETSWYDLLRIEQELFSSISGLILDGHYLSPEILNKTGTIKVSLDLALNSTSTGRITDHEEFTDDDTLVQYRQNVVSSVNDFFQLIADLQDALGEHYQFNDRRALFEDGFDFNDDSTTPGSFREKTLRALICLEYYDHRLTLDNRAVKTLVRIKEQLERNRTFLSGDLLQKATGKCNLLLYKILKRLEEDSSSHKYRYKFPSSRLQDYPDLALGWSTFRDRLDVLYGDADNTNRKRAAVRLAYEKEIHSETFTSHKIKAEYNKDHRNSAEALRQQYESLTSDYKDKCLDASESNNAFSIINSFPTATPPVTFLLQYIKNNELSLQVQSEDENVITTYNRIKSLDHESNLKNYFPHLRYATYCLDRLEVELDKFRIHEDLTETKSSLDLINEAKVAHAEALRAYEWCRQNQFRPFVEPWEQCHIDNDEKNVTIFLASGYSMPVNYERVKLDLKWIDNRIVELKARAVVLRDQIEYRKQIAAVKSDFRDSEKRNIEILSIFAAIVLFVATSVQLFNFAMTLQETVILMLGMAYSLSLFVLVIWLITRRNVKKDVTGLHWFFIGLMVLSTGVMLYLVTCSKPVVTPYQNKVDDVETRVDGLEGDIKPLKDLHRQYLKKESEQE